MTKKQFVEEILPLNEKAFRLSFRLLNDSDMAKDVVQSVYCKLWDEKDKLDSLTNKEAFVIKVTKNACLDRLKLNKTHIDLEQFHNIEEPVHETTEKVELVKKIIKSLPDKQRKIIELRDIEAFTFEEISGVLEIPLNNIRVSLSIARKKVREELHKIYNYGLRQN
jgi:RNA polymerase sigma factor (sigma-70 family)